VKATTISRVLSLFVPAVMLLVTGCGPTRSVNPFALRKENTQLKSALRQYQDQVAQNKIRADNLDADNEQLHNELAMQQEATRRIQEQQSQLARKTPRPASRDYDEYGDEKDYGAAAGRQPERGTGRTASAANSRRDINDDLPAANISGAQVLRDGDAVRIRVTNANLFDPGKATLKPGATKVLDQVAGSIRSSYRGQLIGIEGHTDADPIKKSNWKDNHELSYQRARAVYEYLASRGGIPANQLYIAAYGPNNPIASNSSASGKSQNRRVEFVVRPQNSPQ